MLQDDARKLKQQQNIFGKKPAHEHKRISLSVQLRIEGLAHVEHAAVCDELMNEVMLATNFAMTKTNNVTPSFNEWCICYGAGGEFAQQLALQLESEKALKDLFTNVHGCRICINGRNLMVEARSLHPHFISAGPLAGNFVALPASSSRSIAGGGPCL